MYEQHVHAWSSEGPEEGVSEPLELELQMDLRPCGSWDPNQCLQQEVLLTTEPSPQPQEWWFVCLFCYICLFVLLNIKNYISRIPSDKYDWSDGQCTHWLLPVMFLLVTGHSMWLPIENAKEQACCIILLHHQDTQWVNMPVIKPDDLSLIIGIHTVERENGLQKVVLWPLHVHHRGCMYTHMHKHRHIQIYTYVHTQAHTHTHTYILIQKPKKLPQSCLSCTGFVLVNHFKWRCVENLKFWRSKHRVRI